AYSWDAPMSAHGMMHMVISNAVAGDPYPVDVLFMYMANMAWNSSMNTRGVMEMLTETDPETGEYKIPKLIYSDAYSSEMVAYADLILPETNTAALIDAVDEVWTMTSGLGFEALLRGKAVTTLGAPFYAGWGLTRDLGSVPARRTARPDLLQLAHAALIAYPRYLDPVSGLPCPVEVALDRLSEGRALPRGPLNRIGAKLQGVFASYTWLWRRQR
ncbi:capsular polysaccharide export protein, LipB/KpsS family, partial [Thioclava electrotropha]|uniref:capsular polysaccharide export protein, LipB/KpsS family n=1 Tax=Thioclava electrotropha TaxID=1549850 RepID=UPI003F701989